MKNVQRSLDLIQKNFAISQKAKQKKIEINGKNITIGDILAVSKDGSKLKFTKDEKTLEQIQQTYQRMIQDVEQGVPIYGCNTGYGARASVVVNEGTKKQRMEMARKISESIVHTDVSVGPEIPREVVRSAMAIRMNMLMQGVSAVRLEDLNIFRKMLNSSIIPVVSWYGGLGASGDLAHNSRVLSAARQLAKVKIVDKDGRRMEAKKALMEAGIPALILEPKAGLGLVNGDNFSTAAAAHIVSQTFDYSILSMVVGALVIEALRGSDRSFHPLLSEVRPHLGQKEVSKIYRYLLNGSQLAYQEMKGHQVRPAGQKVQDAYSLRCIPQFEGVNVEIIHNAIKTIEINANSVSDNPLWVTPEFATPGEEPWNWVSGGNFFGLHTGETIDSLRKVITRLVKRNDRHLHRLVNPNENNGLPANLSDKKAISSCTFKGFQLQSGMMEVYSALLSFPVTTMFGIHEENNQDITPHSLTSAILAFEDLRLLKYTLAMNMVAVCQAIDIRGGKKMLSSQTRPLYEFVRQSVSYISVEQPLGPEIEEIAEQIENGEMMEIVRMKVFKDYKG